MMSHHPRRILTPGASRKRKEREAFYSCKLPASAQAAANTSPSKAGKPDPVCSNRLLAGYMAYEFLTEGTLFGEKYDPGRAEEVPLMGSSAEPKGKKPEAEAGVKKEQKSYGEVASILKSDGAHIPGIVNPTQLARWIKM